MTFTRRSPIMSIWYWKNAQFTEPQGPVSAQELKNLARSKRLSRNDLVWKEGMKEWVKAHNLKGLFEVSGSQKATHRAGNSATSSRSPYRSVSSEEVYHSTGMYQKSQEQGERPDAQHGGAFSSTVSFGQRPAANQAFMGVDYEALPTFFSFRGRIRRTDYFFQSFGISLLLAIFMVIIVLVAGSVMGEESVGAAIFVILLSIGATVVLAFPLVKRLHDLNMSAWFYWINFIPIVNILFSLYVLFARGTVGPNKYGPDPRS